MAQVGSLPIDEPVGHPQANPRQFGSVGATIAGLGQETEYLAAGAESIAGHLIAAQRQLKAKQAEISFDRLKMQVYTDLNKATTPEEAQAIYDHAKGQLDSVLTPYEHDRVLARSLGLYRQQQDVEIQGTVNAKKADIITKADKAANEVLGQKSLQDAIATTVGGGSPESAREKFNLQLESSVAHGTMLPQQRDAAMQAWDQEYEKGMIEAYTNSPDGNVRKSNISNLKSSDSYPHLDAATKNALLTKAMARDREIQNLQESEDFNAATNHFDSLTQGWDYESKVKALESGDWLKNNGFVDSSGNPDRKKASMLMEEADRTETRQRRIQTERDNDIISKYADDADAGKLSSSKIDQLVRQDGGSPKASASLRSILRQHIREVRSDAREARAEARAQRQDAYQNGLSTSADLYERIANGDTINLQSDVWDKVKSGDMSLSQAKGVQSALHRAESVEQNKNLIKIQAAPGLSKEDIGKLSLELVNGIKQQNLQGKAIDDFADRLIKQHSEQKVDSHISHWWSNLFSGAAVSTPVLPSSPPAKDYGATDKPDGTPGTLPDGTKVVARGGRVVAQ